MSFLVVDASVSAVWFMEDEEHPVAHATFEALNTVQAIVPQIWHFEIRNVLVFAARRGRIKRGEISDNLKALSVLRIDTDQEPAFDATMQLALTHNLTFYDALYLELAQRRNAQLATLDNALTRSAESEGVSWVPD